ncbi:MAG: SAM-dependent chlorinase/fluorinase [Candidatus Melainabacteria bacterium]
MVTSPVFGLSLPQPSPFQGVNIITDCSDGLTTARIDRRLGEVAEGVQNKRKALSDAFPDLSFLEVKQEGGSRELHTRTVPDILPGSVACAGRALMELAGTPNRDVFVHVTDPGVGGRRIHDRAILVTENNGVHIGPNNGLFSALYQDLVRQGQKPELLTIDLDKVQRFEQVRTDDPDYRTADTFHGKSVFGVIGGALAGGVDPHFFADQRPEARQKVVDSPFFRELGDLNVDKLLSGEALPVRGIEDRTMGNVQLNVHLPREAADRLRSVDEQPGAFPVLQIRNPADPEKSLTLPLRRFFGQVGVGEPLIYAGSTLASMPGNRFNGGLLEVAVNGDHAARKLGFPEPDTRVLETAKSIKREQKAGDDVPDGSVPLEIRLTDAGDPTVWLGRQDREDTGLHKAEKQQQPGTHLSHLA